MSKLPAFRPATALNTDTWYALRAAGTRFRAGGALVSLQGVLARVRATGVSLDSLAKASGLSRHQVTKVLTAV